MAIHYVSYTTGNDGTGDGSPGNPWKTITQATIGRTGGDEVRVEKSADPTALTGTLGFTNNSTAVTGASTAFTTELAVGDFVEGGDGQWYEVVTITDNNNAVLNRVYAGTTGTGVSSRKLGVTSTGAAAAQTTAIQTVSASGSNASNPLIISGGWDLSGTPAQTGLTWFHQMHGTFSNRWGYGLNITAKNYLHVSKIGFLRYYVGINSNSPTYCIFANVSALSGGQAGWYGDGAPLVFIDCAFNGNATYGMYFAANSYVTASNLVLNANNYGVVCGVNVVLNAQNVTANNNGQFGLGLPVVRRFSGLTATGNGTAAVSVSRFPTVIGGVANVGAGTRVSDLVAGSHGSVAFNDVNGTGYSEIWMDGGNIVSQAATAGGTGKEWRFNVTSANRASGFPLQMAIAQVAVGANALVTVTCYFKKSGTGIAGRLLCRGRQIAGVASDVSTTCPNDTTRNLVTITFTPTAAGVVEIEAEAWYVSATDQNVILDDISITQA